VVDHLPRNRKALGSVPSSEKKNQKKKKKELIRAYSFRGLVLDCHGREHGNRQTNMVLEQ